jgi:hypothetical protein
MLIKQCTPYFCWWQSKKRPSGALTSTAIASLLYRADILADTPLADKRAAQSCATLNCRSGTHQETAPWRVRFRLAFAGNPACAPEGRVAREGQAPGNSRTILGRSATPPSVNRPFNHATAHIAATETCGDPRRFAS